VKSDPNFAKTALQKQAQRMSMMVSGSKPLVLPPHQPKSATGTVSPTGKGMRSY
jgi:hypothetical protein